MRALVFALIFFSAVAQALPADEPVSNPTPMPSEPSHPRHRGHSQSDTLIDTSPTPEEQEAAISPTGAPPEKPAWLPISLNVHGGLTFDTEDPDARSQWRHDMGYSYLASLGAYWNFPKLFSQQLWFFAGVDFSYLHNEEQLTSDEATSYLHSDMMEFFATGGLGWQPAFLGGHIGAMPFISAPIWSLKTTQFDANGYSHNFGSRGTGTFVYGLDFFYDINHRWKPYFGYEYRVGSIMTLGVTYAF